MSEERLSKLQKWILMALYLIGPNGAVAVKDLSLTSIHGLRIWEKDEDLESPWKKTSRRMSKKVSLSRALKNLEFKGLLFRYGNSENPLSGRAKDMLEAVVPGFNDDFAKVMLLSVGNVKGVALTDEGMAKAKELLNVNKSEINNKRGGDPGCENV